MNRKSFLAIIAGSIAGIAFKLKPATHGTTWIPGRGINWHVGMEYKIKDQLVTAKGWKNGSLVYDVTHHIGLMSREDQIYHIVMMERDAVAWTQSEFFA